jgi:P27 family predicted phage terminase small subunit
LNPRKPKVLKLQQGTYRSDRNPANEPEPERVVQEIPPPKHLNKYAKKFWKEICTELIDTGVLTVVDWAAFEICADSYGMYREMKEEIAKESGSLGIYLSDKNSQTVPMYAAMNKAIENFLKYSSTLGLNPVSRNRIDLKEKKKEEIDPMEALLDDQANG